MSSFPQLSIPYYPSPPLFSHIKPCNATPTSSHSTQSNSSSNSHNNPSIHSTCFNIHTPISTLPSFKSLNLSLLNSIYKQIIKEENDSKHKSLPHLEPPSTILDIHRALLIDWLVNVHLYLRLSDECFFLTVSIIDQFITNVNNFHKERLQLLGVSALLVSAKFIEHAHPSIEELCMLCDNAYTKMDIVHFEKEILEKLDYVIVQDYVVNFFDILCLFFNFTLKEYYLGKFLLEISIMDLSLLMKYKKSLLVLSIIYLVMKMNIDKHKDYKKCFMFLKDRKVTEPQVKMCGNAVLALMENVKKCTLYTSSLQKYNFNIGKDYCAMDIDS